jgi:hypothetical protein
VNLIFFWHPDSRLEEFQSQDRSGRHLESIPFIHTGISSKDTITGNATSGQKSSGRVISHPEIGIEHRSHMQAMLDSPRQCNFHLILDSVFFQIYGLQANYCLHQFEIAVWLQKFPGDRKM